MKKIFRITNQKKVKVFIFFIFFASFLFESAFSANIKKTTIIPAEPTVKNDIKNDSVKPNDVIQVKTKTDIENGTITEIKSDESKQNNLKKSKSTLDPWASNGNDFDSDDNELIVNDPYEKFNRVMFTFNDKLDKWILRPVAIGYNKVMPQKVVTCVDNFFVNIITVATVMDDTLQGNFYQATSDAWRFIINSTIGVLGIFDVATNFGLLRNDEDFGLTLAKWGYKDSAYLVLPFFGPTTIRDLTTMPEGYYLGYYNYIKEPYIRNTLFGLKIINTRAILLNYENLMQQVALDPYVFLRSTYFQNRNYKIARNNQLNDPYTVAEMITPKIYDYLDQ